MESTSSYFDAGLHGYAVLFARLRRFVCCTATVDDGGFLLYTFIVNRVCCPTEKGFCCNMFSELYGTRQDELEKVAGDIAQLLSVASCAMFVRHMRVRSPAPL